MLFYFYIIGVVKSSRFVSQSVIDKRTNPNPHHPYNHIVLCALNSKTHEKDIHKKILDYF